MRYFECIGMYQMLPKTIPEVEDKKTDRKVVRGRGGKK